MRHVAWGLIPLLLAVSAAAAAADPPKASTPPDPPTPPATRLVLNNLVAFRYNPLGFEDQLRAGLQRRLYQSSNPLLRDNFFFGGVAPRANPAFIKLGPSVEIQPLSIFNLRLGAEFIGYYSTFGFLQSFASPTDEYSDSKLLEGRRQTPARNYSTYGVHAMIEPTLQFKLGPVVLRSKLALEYWRMQVRDGDRVFYDVTLDTLIPKAGWVMQNDLDLLYLHELTSLTGSLKGARLTAGVRYTAVKPFYKSTDYAPGDDPSLASNDHHRVGPLVAFTFFDRGYTSFNRPTAILIANWYVKHRYRTGQDVSGAIPYLIVGFSFQSDLLD